uniref:Uncharacterized protein n=1 Tax=Candidatus Kentrum sp. FM TaxID=2126340 RepID=A0A450SCD1_9GAMM|nr:MAG: hypothetical protein BECKFM1743C_GA0114222_100789 [Candidatus Kentron sp. FM]VFJ63883.1 MAG: hypothetical protein BECKFM1743A_GA0114220_103432 [Candidatus Kentron sp. FM]VFK09758.1 MAG: hypothetical protein BECKFM1743B_GA0114221_1011413 [Candidatus Kentron sp. FM]
MGGAIDALTAKVPAVQGNLGVGSRFRNRNGADSDAVGSVMFAPSQSFHGVHQTGLAYFAFADKDQFGLIEGDLFDGLGAKVGEDSLGAFLVGCGEFGVEGVAVEEK